MQVNIESLFLFFLTISSVKKNLQLIYQGKISGETQLNLRIIATFLNFLQITLVHEVSKCFNENL